MCDLYNKIEGLCLENSISITQMCKESGASRASLTDLKKGRKQSLSVETLTKIASYFGVSVDYLLGKEQKENTPAASSDRDVDRFMELFTKLTPEQQERELAYLQQLVDAQGK